MQGLTMISDSQPYTPYKVLNTGEAAKYCGSSKSTFDKLRLIGTGARFIRITPNRVGYLLEDLDLWLNSKKRFASTSDAA
jgi:predicted DNA-binding transcriptional regulator AlpA